MRSRVCPRCGAVFSGKSCPRCAKTKAKSHWTRNREQEAARKQQNPWRTSYGSTEYRNARQVALERTGGRCAVSGVRIADKVNGKWVMRKNGGVHHVVPLSQGGTNAPSNLVPLETSVHNRIDAEERRKRAGDNSQRCP